MADTIGSLIDKLFTIDMKMWNNQELFYKIRKMSFKEFKERYFNSEENIKELWETFQKTIDLNLQRNKLIDEIDEKIVSLLKDAVNGKDLDDGANIQRKHKTY